MSSDTFMKGGFRWGCEFVLFTSLVLHASVAAAGGPWRAEEGNTPGWALITPEERIAHQAMVRSFTNYDDCRAYQVAHHRLMEERAEQRGLPPPAGRRDFCARLRSPKSPPDREGQGP